MQKTSLEIDSDGIAVITLQNPPVNALHPTGGLGLMGLCVLGHPCWIFHLIDVAPLR